MGGPCVEKGRTTIVNSVFQGTPAGRRPLGRPRMRWKDQVIKDINILGSLFEVTDDRIEWRRIVGEAKNRLGFQ